MLGSLCQAEGILGNYSQVQAFRFKRKKIKETISKTSEWWVNTLLLEEVETCFL